MRQWRKRYTRRLEEAVPSGLRVRVPSDARDENTSDLGEGREEPETRMFPVWWYGYSREGGGMVSWETRTGEEKETVMGLVAATEFPCPDCKAFMHEYEGFGGTPPHTFFVLHCMACNTVHDVRWPDEEYDYNKPA